MPFAVGHALHVQRSLAAPNGGQDLLIQGKTIRCKLQDLAYEPGTGEAINLQRQWLQCMSADLYRVPVAQGIIAINGVDWQVEQCSQPGLVFEATLIKISS